MGSERRFPFVALAVCVLLSFTFSAWRSWRNVEVDASVPPDVCRLVRPETFDILVPGHDALQSNRGSSRGSGFSWCRAKGVSPVDGSPIHLEVLLSHYGRLDGEGPRCVERSEIPYSVNLAPIKGQLPLGDFAGYFIDYEAPTERYRIDLIICLGTYETYVQYVAAEMTVPSLIDSASTVGLEVLSHRRRDALFPPLRHWPIIVGTLP